VILGSLVELAVFLGKGCCFKQKKEIMLWELDLVRKFSVISHFRRSGFTMVSYTLWVLVRPITFREKHRFVC